MKSLRLQLRRVFMWIFAINGLIYVTCLAVSGNWRLMVPRPGAWVATLKEATQVMLYDLHLSREHLPAKKHNGAQKIAYTAISCWPRARSISPRRRTL